MPQTGTPCAGEVAELRPVPCITGLQLGKQLLSRGWIRDHEERAAANPAERRGGARERILMCLHVLSPSSP
jgi:hypothetical protein